MSTFRSFSLGAASTLLIFSLLLLPLVLSLQMTFNSPAKVKESVSKSGIYDSVVDKNILVSNTGALSDVLTDPGIKAALKSAVPPSYLQANIDAIIDDSYAYVQGGASPPSFLLELGATKTTFANNVANYIKQKYDGLPRCTTLAPPSVSVEAILEATCVPVGVSSQTVSDYARNEITNMTPFSGGDQFNVASLSGVRSSLLVGSLTNLRSAYPLFISLLYILPIASLALAIGVLFLAATRRQGVKRVATLLLVAGLINAAVAALALWLLDMAGLDELLSAPALHNELTLIIQSLTDTLRLWWLGISGGFVLVAIIIYAVLGLTRKSQPMSL